MEVVQSFSPKGRGVPERERDKEKERWSDSLRHEKAAWVASGETEK